MKITLITIERVKNLGNYESCRLGVTAELDEGDDANKVTDDLKFYLDYKLNQDIRDTKGAQLQTELDSNTDEKGKELTEVGSKERKKWLNQYGEAHDKFMALDFVYDA